MLGKLFTYGLFATTATAGVAGYSLATGQLPAINNAALGVAAAAFNTIQNQYNVDFDNAWVCLAQSEFRATNLRAKRANHPKSNFELNAGLISFRYSEPLKNLLRVDVADYIKSKDIILSSFKLGDCTAKLEIIKEQTRPKTTEERAAKLLKKNLKKDVILENVLLSNVKVEVSDRRRSIWAAGVNGMMQKIVRKQGEIVSLPAVALKHVIADKIRLKHAIFDIYTGAEVLGSVGENSSFFIGSGMTSDGDNCLERKLTAFSIPLNTAFNSYVAFPINLIQQANVDIHVTSKPVVLNRQMQSYDYLHEFKISIKDISSSDPSDEGLLRDATALLVKSFLERSARKRDSIDLTFDLMINESEFNKDMIAGAVATALTQKAIQGGLNLINTLSSALNTKVLKVENNSTSEPTK